jgi:hypothetical protein
MTSPEQGPRVGANEFYFDLAGDDRLRNELATKIAGRPVDEAGEAQAWELLTEGLSEYDKALLEQMRDLEVMDLNKTLIDAEGNPTPEAVAITELVAGVKARMDFDDVVAGEVVDSAL